MIYIYFLRDLVMAVMIVVIYRIARNGTVVSTVSVEPHEPPNPE